MNQTEIDELRRLASVSREPRHGIGCIASDCALASAARNALPALLDAAEERDALLRIINDSFLSLNNPTSTLAFDGRNLVPHVEEASRYAEILRLERDALRAERDKANLRERNIFVSLRMALGEDLGGGGGLVEILNGIEGLQDQRVAAESLAWDALGRPEGTHDTSNVQRLCEAHGALKAKLEAMVEAMERIKDIMGGHDGCQGFSSTEDVWGIADKALAAAKVQP